MDQIKAQLNFLRIPPRKVRLLADVIRGLPVQEAEAKLILNPRRPKDALLKLLRSAVANAKNNHKLVSEKLFVKEIRVDQGPKSKRWTPRSRGSAGTIEKKTSHVTIILGFLENAKPNRFVIEIKKPVKKKEGQEKKKSEKTETVEKKSSAPEKPKPVGQPGVFKRVFRRKAI